MKNLTPKQEAFAIMAADPYDPRTLDEKAQECGYAEKYGYQLARVPIVAAEIERLVAENMKALRSRLPQVIRTVGDMAVRGDLKAAELYLETAGVLGKGGGVTVVNNVTATSGDDDFERRAIAARESVLAGVAESEKPE